MTLYAVFQNGREIAFGLTRSQAERMVSWGRIKFPNRTYAIVAAEAA